MPSSHARVTSSKFTKRQLVSQLVTRGDKGRQWSDSGPIKSESENTNQLLNVKNCFYFCLFALKVELHELNFKIGQILWSNHLRGMNDRWQSKQRREPGVNRTSDFHHQLCICERLCVFLAKIKKHLTEVKSNRAPSNTSESHYRCGSPCSDRFSS